MPLSNLSFICGIKWTLDDPIVGFSDRTQDDPGQFFNLQNLDLTKFNQIYAAAYNIPTGNFFDCDLWSFTDLAGALTGFTLQGVIGTLCLPKVGNIQFGPSPSFGLQWPFQGMTQGLNLTAGGEYSFSLPGAGPAQVVTATSRNIRLSNPGVVAATGYFFAVGG